PQRSIAHEDVRARVRVASDEARGVALERDEPSVGGDRRARAREVPLRPGRGDARALRRLRGHGVSLRERADEDGAEGRAGETADPSPCIHRYTLPPRDADVPIVEA